MFQMLPFKYYFLLNELIFCFRDFLEIVIFTCNVCPWSNKRNDSKCANFIWWENCDFVHLIICCEGKTVMKKLLFKIKSNVNYLIFNVSLLPSCTHAIDVSVSWLLQKKPLKFIFEGRNHFKCLWNRHFAITAEIK